MKATGVNAAGDSHLYEAGTVIKTVGDLVTIDAATGNVYIGGILVAELLAEFKAGLQITGGADLAAGRLFYSFGGGGVTLRAKNGASVCFTLENDAGTTIFDVSNGEQTLRFPGAGNMVPVPAIFNAASKLVPGQDSAVLSTAPTWYKFTKTYADIKAGAVAGNNDIEVFSLPAKGFLHAAVSKPSAQFVFSETSTLQTSLGLTGDLARYLPLVVVSDPPSNTVFSPASAMDIQNFGAATSIRLAGYSPDNNLSALTAGSIDIWLMLSLLP